MIKDLKFKIKNLALDILFPKYCVNCGQEADWLCFNCTQKIVTVVSQICPECEKLSDSGQYHKNCAKDKALKGIICASYFKEGPIREMIHNFKYNGVTELAEPLGELMVEVFVRCHSRPVGDRIGNLDPRCRSSIISDRLKDDNLVVTFVPLHWRRQAQRDYNQLELLARKIGEKLGIKVIDLIKKHKITPRQAELSGKVRRKNLSEAFILKGDTSIKKIKIIIIDDVTTTVRL